MPLPISGFTAIYNPQMMAMMPIQSALMMYEAGFFWQKGKRDASALTNEENNALTPIMAMKAMMQIRKDTVPLIAKSLDDMLPLTKILMTQFGDIVREAIKAAPEAIGNIFQQSYQGADNPYGIQNVRYDSAGVRDIREGQTKEKISQFGVEIEKQIKGSVKYAIGQKEAEQKRIAAAAKEKSDLQRNRFQVMEDMKNKLITPQEVHTVRGHQSTQSLKLELGVKLKEIITWSKQLASTPQTYTTTVKERWYSNVRGGDTRKPIMRSKPYMKTVQKQVLNPQIKHLQMSIKQNQNWVINVQKYLQWRKSK